MKSGAAVSEHAASAMVVPCFVMPSNQPLKKIPNKTVKVPYVQEVAAQTP